MLELLLFLQLFVLFCSSAVVASGNSSSATQLCSSCSLNGLVSSLPPPRIEELELDLTAQPDISVTATTVTKITSFLDGRPASTTVVTITVPYTIRRPSGTLTSFVMTSGLPYTSKDYPGLTFTYPSPYVAFTGFQFAPACTSQPTAVPFDFNEHVNELVFPAAEANAIIPDRLRDTIEAFPEFQEAGAVGLSNCTGTVSGGHALGIQFGPDLQRLRIIPRSANDGPMRKPMRPERRRAPWPTPIGFKPRVVPRRQNSTIQHTSVLLLVGVHDTQVTIQGKSGGSDGDTGLGDSDGGQRTGGGDTNRGANNDGGGNNNNGGGNNNNGGGNNNNGGGNNNNGGGNNNNGGGNNNNGGGNNNNGGGNNNNGGGNNNDGGGNTNGGGSNNGGDGSNNGGNNNGGNNSGGNNSGGNNSGGNNSGGNTNGGGGSNNNGGGGSSNGGNNNGGNNSGGNTNGGGGSNNNGGGGGSNNNGGGGTGSNNGGGNGGSSAPPASNNQGGGVDRGCDSIASCISAAFGGENPAGSSSSGGSSNGGSAGSDSSAGEGSLNTGGSSNTGSGSGDPESGGSSGTGQSNGGSGAGGSSGGSGSSNSGTPGSQPALIGGSTVQLSAGEDDAIIVGGQTIQPGHTAVINGVPVSNPASGSTGGPALIIDGSSTIALNPPAAATPPTLVFGSATLTADPSGAFHIGSGQTLTPGGAITSGGQTLSLAPDGSYVVFNGQTSILQGSAPTTPPVLTVNSDVHAPTISNGKTWYSVAPGVTLTPGGVANVSGTVISLRPDASELVIGSSTSKIRSGSVAASATRTSSSVSKRSSSVTSSTSATRVTSAPSSTSSGAAGGREGAVEGWLIGAAGFLLWVL